MKKPFALLILLVFARVCASQVHIPAGDPQTWSAQQALSSYVGQTVVFDMPIVVCSNSSSNGLVVSPWRMFEPDNQGIGGSQEYITAMHVNGHCSFTLTGVSGYHRCGEKIYGLRARVNSTSKLSFEGGTWSGNTRADLEQGLPDLGDYRLLVCGFNLENYFVVNMGSLGARSYSEHQDQRAKISAALKQINADIFGFCELEQGDDALQEIVNDLNKNLPGRDYHFFRANQAATDYQKSDIVYDANTVEPIGEPVHIDTELADRKKMVCFREKATGEKFIYSINHFKAMTGGSDSESRRINESHAVINFYNSYRSNSSIRDNDILIMGDLNSHAKTTPVLIFTDNGMIDLHRAFHADSSYSYMFGGKASYIDHALCNSSLYGQITGVAGYHINSDENDKYTYDGEWSDNTMFRCSDHDPVLVGLKLDSTLLYDPTPQLNSAEIISGEAGQLIIQNAHSEKGKSYYAIYSVNGVQIARKEITSAYYEVELPSAPGMYIVYVYFNGQVYQRRMIAR